MGRLNNISGKDAVRAFQKAGWQKIGQVGSHVIMVKADAKANLPIRPFNESGIEAIKAKKKPGRPVEFTPEHQSAIVELALVPPGVMGLPFMQWSWKNCVTR